MQSGTEQFREWVARRFVGSTRPQRDAAELFGWSETVISKLCSGARLPGLMVAIRIQQVTGIPPTAWVESRLDESRVAKAAGGRKR